MRKIIILVFGFMLFSACTEGALSLDDKQPVKNDSVNFKSFPEKPIDTVDSERKKREEERNKAKGNKEEHSGAETNEGKSQNP
uniref:hypothetical protein n=1 Tax=Ornithobacterium rhinotracheale TaxID=28251 RepID=UPI00129C3F0C|nr:hypothetical protein [Ornithobacterium rhinotracheale]